MEVLKGHEMQEVFVCLFKTFHSAAFPQTQDPQGRKHLKY